MGDPAVERLHAQHLLELAGAFEVLTGRVAGLLAYYDRIVELQTLLEKRRWLAEFRSTGLTDSAAYGDLRGLSTADALAELSSRTDAAVRWLVRDAERLASQ